VCVCVCVEGGKEGEGRRYCDRVDKKNCFIVAEHMYHIPAYNRKFIIIYKLRST